MCYDNLPIYGIAKPSGVVPNCRPNFFEETGFYVMVLDSNYIGEPGFGHEGVVNILGMDDISANNNLHSEGTNEENNEGGGSKMKWLIAIICLLVLLGVVYHLNN